MSRGGLHGDGGQAPSDGERRRGDVHDAAGFIEYDLKAGKGSWRAGV